MSRPISPLDLSFLLNESRDAPQHVAGVLEFENPGARSGWTIADLVRSYRAATPVAPFDCIPEFPRLGRPRWVTVRDHDMLHHVQHVALPAPGTDAQLNELTQQWHSELLDRERPLFQLVVVEGLEGGRFAIYAKLHHAIVDGTAAIMRLLGSLSDDPGAPMLPPLFAVDPGGARRQSPPAAVARSLSASMETLKEQARAAGELSSEFWSRVLSRVAGKRSEGSVPFEAPLTPINVPVRYGRAFAHLSLPMEPMRIAAKRFEGTVNDAVLAVVDYAVARYLDERGHLLRRPLHALVPVSLRDAETTAGGTMVSAVACALGDPGADVRTRLAQVVGRMNSAKDRIRSFSKAAATDYFVGLFFVAQGLGAAGIRRPVANFVGSIVPGSAGEVFLGGARLAGVYPMNVLTVRLGLSVTLVSRAGQLDFGFTASRTVLPDPARIASLCREGFEALRESGEPASTARGARGARPAKKKSARRSKGKPRAPEPSNAHRRVPRTRNARA